MAMKQVSLHTSNSAAVRTHQRSQNIVHCVSFDRQYSIVRARERSKFTNIDVKSGAAMRVRQAYLFRSKKHGQ